MYAQWANPGDFDYGANMQLFGTINNGYGLYIGPQATWASKYTLGNVPDGLSNTVMLAEKFCYGNEWPMSPGYEIIYVAAFAYTIQNGAYPLSYWSTFTANGEAFKPPIINSNNWHYVSPWSPHPGCSVNGIADGSVRVLGPVSDATWMSVIMPEDGTVPGSDW
jgi:hypothetical protein